VATDRTTINSKVAATFKIIVRSFVDFPFHRHTVQLIDTHPLLTLTLLGSLVRAQRLGDADERYLRQLTKHVQTRLGAVDINEHNVSIMSGLLPI
jgi:hypothetical protein